jgi:hypothetical protein
VVTRQITGFGTISTLSIIQVNDDPTIIDLPVPNSMYVISSTSADYRLFRVLANKEQKGYQFEITAVQHAPQKFDDIDQYQPLVPPSGTPYGSWPVAQIRNLTATVNTYVDHGSNKSDITLSWSPPPSPNPNDPPGSNDPRVSGYEIIWSSYTGGVSSGVWTKLTTTLSTSFTQINVPKSTYSFVVRPITPISVGPYTQVFAAPVTGLLPEPSQPQNLTANVGYNIATLFWDEVTDTGTAGYYVYRDYTYLDRVNNHRLTSYQISFDDPNPHVYSVRAFNTNSPLDYRLDQTYWRSILRLTLGLSCVIHMVTRPAIFVMTIRRWVTRFQYWQCAPDIGVGPPDSWLCCALFKGVFPAAAATGVVRAR